MRIVLYQIDNTEIFSKMNHDWLKKYGEKGRRELYSTCPPGIILNNKFGVIYQHKCDTQGGSSGAPITTKPISFCEVSNESLTLLAIHIWGQGNQNYGRALSGKNLEAIYQFIDKIK